MKHLVGQKEEIQGWPSLLLPPAQLTFIYRSGTSTPIPVDAPPSVIATSFARKETRARNKRRLFPTIEYAARFSHFDPRSDHRDFRGFFVLFWVGLAIMVITTVLRNLKETGYPFVFRQRQLLVENIWELALSDLMMAGSTAVSLPLHKLFASSNRWLSWKRGGIWVQSIVQAAWLVYWVEFVSLSSSARSEELTTRQCPLHPSLDVDSAGLLHIARASHVHEDALLGFLQWSSSRDQNSSSSPG